MSLRKNTFQVAATRELDYQQRLGGVRHTSDVIGRKKMIAGESVFVTRHGLAIAILFLTACQTSTNNIQPTNRGTDAVKQTNVWLENYEKQGPTPNSRVDMLQKEIWRDKPQYAALAGARHVKEVRMTYAAPGKCPGGLRPGEVDAKVDVSFVVGLDGRVEDARVIWSSDDRFNAAALEAMRQDTFIPAMGPNGVERAMYVKPYHFTTAGAY
jgi:TonB family protein